MLNSNIQWTHHTWNIARGCSKVDEDCKYCYMYRDSLKGTRYNPKVVQQTKTVFNAPLKIKEPALFFVSSLTDVFHPDCDSFRQQMWDIIRQCPQHIFQILTKRPQRITKDTLPPDWGNGYANVWMGTSVGSQQGTYRVAEMIMRTMPPTRLNNIFLSLEPLHSPLQIDSSLLKYFGWVIIGGESGNDVGQYRYRPCQVEWIESLVADCKAHNIPVFVKQLGTHLAKQYKLRDRTCSNMDEWPTELEHLKIREFPEPMRILTTKI